MNDKSFSESLPKPLSSEEITTLFIEYQNGSNYARETLITHNIRLVIYEVYKNFKNVNYSKNDLVSIGNIGLIKAIDTYDRKKNTKFITYAAKCINNEILMFLEKLKKDKNTKSLDEDPKEENFKPLSIADNKTHIEQDYEKKEQIKDLLLLIDLLPEKQTTIIKMYFGLPEGKTFTEQEIASSLNIGQPWVSKIITKTTAFLKTLYQELSTNNPSIVEDAKELSSLYDLLENFTVKEIDELLSLQVEERSLILLKGGLLDAKLPSINPYILQNYITKTTCLKLIDYLLEYPPMMDNLTLKEAMIFLFKLGFINNQYYNTTVIANFLELDELEVIAILKDAIKKINNNKNNQNSLKK